MPGRVKGTNTMIFIQKQEISPNRIYDVTYGRIVCDYWEGKEEPNRTRLTIGADKVHYPGDCGTPTADLLTVQILLNRVILTPKAKFMTMDIKFFS